MEIMNCFVNDIFHRIAEEAGRVAGMNGRKTIKTREIQTAVRLILPGELGRHAVSEGIKAMRSWIKKMVKMAEKMLKSIKIGLFSPKMTCFDPETTEKHVF